MATQRNFDSTPLIDSYAHKHAVGIVSGPEAIALIPDNPSLVVLNFSERRVLLQILDCCMLGLAFWLSLLWRGVDTTSPALWPQAIGWFLTLLAAWLPSSLLFECYKLAFASNITQILWRTGVACVLANIIYLFVPWSIPTLPAGRLELLQLPLLCVACIWVWRLSYVYVIGHPRCEHRTLIVGAGKAGREVVREIEELYPASSFTKKWNQPGGGPGYRIVGFVDDDPEKQMTLVDGIPVLGSGQKISDIVQRYKVDEIVLAISRPETMSPEMVLGILECHEQGTSLVSMGRLCEMLTGRVPVEHAARQFHVALPMGRSATYRIYHALKRLFDVVFSLFGCLILALAVPFVALGNRIWSPGPLFYRQERVGVRGQSFEIIKFRSMMVNAEKVSGAVWAQENDPRITKIGKFLRLTRVDELPQFINVLRGEMAIVGPRPERPQFVNQLAQEIPFYRARHAVKPGLTGWAQVKYRYGASVEDSLIKLQYDLYYIKYQNIWLDLLILMRTVWVVFGFKGR